VDICDKAYDDEDELSYPYYDDVLVLILYIWYMDIHVYMESLWCR
jgi:hypothetical protein